MLPDLPILIALVLGLSVLQEGPVDPLFALGGTLASVVVGVALTWMAGERGVKAVQGHEARKALGAVQQVGLWPLVAWMGTIAFFGWGTLVANEVPRTLWLARYVVLLLPAAVLFAFSWIQRGRIEEVMAATRGAILPGRGAREHLKQGLKRNGIALLPLLAVIGLLEGIWLLGALGVPGVGTASRWLEAMPVLALGVMLAVLAAMTLLLPSIFRRVLSTEPLPAGRTRDLLEHQAASLGLRYRDILLWKTSGRVLNAMVVGVTPGTRLIFLTDALIRRLPTEEVLAVFTHEAGHAKKQHLPLFLLLFVTTALLFHVAGDVLLSWGIHEIVVVALHLAFLWFVLLGTVSRLFEREADVYGAEHGAELLPDEETDLRTGAGKPIPAGAAHMIRALERIRQLSGRGASHRHGTIEARARYLAAYATEPAVRKDFAAVRKRFNLAVLGTALLAALVTVWSIPRDLAAAKGWLALEDGVQAYEAALVERRADREAAARPHWERALALFEASVEHVEGRSDLRAAQVRLLSLFNAADTAFHGLGDEEAGRVGFGRVLEEIETGPLSADLTGTNRFSAQIDLGRIEAHRDAPEALDHWRAARGARPEAEGAWGAYYRGRLQLLRAVLLARPRFEAAVREELGDLDGSARAVLEALTGREETGVEWDELRRDARLELDLLGAPAGAED